MKTPVEKEVEICVSTPREVAIFFLFLLTIDIQLFYRLAKLLLMHLDGSEVAPWVLVTYPHSFSKSLIKLGRFHETKTKYG